MSNLRALPSRVFHTCHMPSFGVNLLISLDDILLLFYRILLPAYSLICILFICYHSLSLLPY